MIETFYITSFYWPIIFKVGADILNKNNLFSPVFANDRPPSKVVGSMAYYFFMFRWHVVVRFSRNDEINITKNDIGFSLSLIPIYQGFSLAWMFPVLHLAGKLI